MSQITPDSVCKSFKDEYTQQVFGLILACLHPPPPSLVSFYSRFRENVEKGLTALGISSVDYYLYPIESLHLTVATFHPFTRSPPDNEAEVIHTWSQFMFDMKNRSSEWPAADSTEKPQVELCNASIQSNGVGTLLYQDTNDYISQIRKCLHHYSNTAHGNRILSQMNCKSDEIVIPTITHSTVLRWCSQPNVALDQLNRVFQTSFEAAGRNVMIPLECVKLIREWEPYMRKHCYCEEIRLSSDITQDENSSARGKRR